MARKTGIDIDAVLDESGSEVPAGRSKRDVGPSDSSDTGADMVGVGGLDSTTDRQGTGDRASADAPGDEETARDLAPDALVPADKAGLGDGLDQAEEAQLGVTDEDVRPVIAARRVRRPGK